MNIRIVDINSKKFESRVMEILSGMIERDSVVQSENIHTNPRFGLIPDGWIKDFKLGIEWGPSSTEGMNYKNAVEYCNSLNARIPTLDELNSTIDRTVHEPAIDKKVFKDTKSEYYWTSDKTAWRSDAHWVVGFGSGYVDFSLEDDYIYVRPVRVSQC